MEVKNTHKRILFSIIFIIFIITITPPTKGDICMRDCSTECAGKPSGYPSFEQEDCLNACNSDAFFNCEESDEPEPTEDSSDSGSSDEADYDTPVDSYDPVQDSSSEEDYAQEESSQEESTEQSNGKSGQGEYTSKKAKENEEKKKREITENCEEGFLSTKDFLDKCLTDSGVYLGNLNQENSDKDLLDKPSLQGQPSRYPDLRQTPQEPKITQTGGEIYVITAAGAAPLEGMGVTVGETNKFSIALDTFEDSDEEQIGNSLTGSVVNNNEYTLKIEGAGDWLEVSTKTVEDPNNNEQLLKVEFDIDDNAPIGKQDIELFLMKAGKIIKTIPFELDVHQKDKPLAAPELKGSKILKFSGIIISLMIIGYASLLFKKAFKTEA
ncbi:hypothetical protein ACFLZZ_00430 [Nanoarchaeota archaeon]